MSKTAVAYGDMDEMLKVILAHVRARDWEQFHTPKDMAIQLSLEAAEVLKQFLWRTPQKVEDYLKTNKDDVAKESADVLYNVLLSSHYLNIDLKAAFDKKMAENAKKYPVAKAKGSHKKYTHYQEDSEKDRAT